MSFTLTPKRWVRSDFRFHETQLENMETLRVIGDLELKIDNRVKGFQVWIDKKERRYRRSKMPIKTVVVKARRFDKNNRYAWCVLYRYELSNRW